MKSLLLSAAWMLGLYTPPDRRILEQRILPYFRDKRVLFVGTRFYTRKYPSVIPGMVTIDANPRMAKWGAPIHLIIPVQELRGETFDAIIINGVFGWGIDDADAARDALQTLYDALKPNGELVIGFNRSRCPPLDTSRFKPFFFPPLGEQELTVATPFAEKSHTYQFFRK